LHEEDGASAGRRPGRRGCAPRAGRQARRHDSR